MKRVCSGRTIALAGTLAGMLAAGISARAATSSGPGGAPPPSASPTAPAPAKPPVTTPAATDPVAPPAPGTPASISLDLPDTTLEKALQRLGSAIGSEVRLDGPGSRSVSLKLEDLTVPQALARAASVLHGTWKRIFIFTKSVGVVPPPAQPSGLTVSLNLTDASCQTAAIIAAKASGGRLETTGELTGKVTLVGKELPVEETMSKIAQAAGMTWRTIYEFKADATVAPETADVKPAVKPDPKQDDSSIPIYERDRGLFGPKGNRRYHNQPKEKRTRYNTLGKYGVKMPERKVPDVEKMEKLSHLGAFAGVFSADDEKEREERIKRFRAALETQARRLDAYKPEYRHAATQLAKSQLQSILKDVQALDETQKKEVSSIVDYIKKRLQDLK
jgi:hypothetical protein